MSLAPSTSAHDYISSLPNEVLASVFQQFVSEAASSSSGFSVFGIARGLPSQFVLMGVCKEWETQCKSCPKLWTNICINVRPIEESILGNGAPNWKRFALMCEDVLKRSATLPLTLEVQDWYIMEDNNEDVVAHRHLNKERFGEEVADSKSLAYAILQLVTSQSFRWKNFSMRGYTGTYPNIHQQAGIPWAQLRTVAHQIPILESLSFHNLWHLPFSNYLQSERCDIFLDAPSLSIVNFNATVVDLDIPWSQLTEITLDYAGFAWVLEPQFDDYLIRAMRHSTAHTVSLDNTSNRLNLFNTPRDLSVIENFYVVQLRLSPLSLPSNLRFPNLTSLSFKVGTVSGEDLYGTLQVNSLLKNSGCRLLDLTIYEWPQDYEGHSIKPLLPYLETLRSLTINASPVEKIYLTNMGRATKFSYIVRKLRDVLVSTTPVNMPKLTTLTVNIILPREDERHATTPPREDATTPRYVYDAPLASAVWDIVWARMVRPISKMEKFRVNIPYYPVVEAIEVNSQEFKESQAWRSIQAADVDFEIDPPVA